MVPKTMVPRMVDGVGSRLDHVEEVRGEGGAETGETADFAETEDGEEDGGGEVAPAEDFAHQASAGKELNGDLREDGGDERDDGGASEAAFVETFFEELGHGEDFGLHVAGDEEPAHDKEAKAGGPFVAADGEADEVLAGSALASAALKPDITNDQEAGNDDGIIEHVRVIIQG